MEGGEGGREVGWREGGIREVGWRCRDGEEVPATPVC